MSQFGTPEHREPSADFRRSEAERHTEQQESGESTFTRPKAPALRREYYKNGVLTKLENIFRKQD